MGCKFRNDLIGSSKICDMNVFEKYPVKSITTGEGGAILTDNETLYKKIKLLGIMVLIKILKKQFSL